MRDLNVMESKSPRKRSAVETGVLRPRAATGTQRNRGGLNLLLAESPVLIALPPTATTTAMTSSETQASPALRATTITTTTTLRSSLHTPTTLAEASDESDHECDKTAQQSLEQKEALAKKKSVTFRLGDTGATAPEEEKEEEEEEEEADKRKVPLSPRFSPSGRRVGPNKRMLLSTRSSPLLTLGLSMSDDERVKDDDNDDDDEIATLVLSPEIRRSHSPVVRSPPGSLLSPRRVASESPCTFDRLSSSNKPVNVRKAATLEQVSGGSLDSGMPNGKGSRS